MARVYQVITGNWLHRSKKIFNSIEDCMAHIKKIVDMKKVWVTYYQAHSSYHITMIDTDEMPQYKKIFKEHAEIRPPSWEKPEQKPIEMAEMTIEAPKRRRIQKTIVGNPQTPVSALEANTERIK